MKDRINQFAHLSLAAIAQANKGQGVMQMDVTPVCYTGKVCGRAVTVMLEPEVGAITEEVLDAIHPGDVLVVAAGGLCDAFLDELTQHKIKQRGAVAVITDGAVRNIGNYNAIGLAAFAKCVFNRLQTGTEAAAVNVPVICAGVPGDRQQNQGGGNGPAESYRSPRRGAGTQRGRAARRSEGPARGLIRPLCRASNPTVSPGYASRLKYE